MRPTRQTDNLPNWPPEEANGYLWPVHQMTRISQIQLWIAQAAL